jgi:hypothetical protein
MLSTLHRLQLATRIHVALLCKAGTGVDVVRMLRESDYAHEALELCRGSGDLSLNDLADNFDDTLAAENARLHLVRAAQSAREALAQIALGTTTDLASQPRRPVASSHEVALL